MIMVDVVFFHFCSTRLPL